MRSTIAIATMLAVGAGVANVGALNLLGSDTLKALTIQMLKLGAPHEDCGGSPTIPGGAQTGTLLYDGTGSGNGQAGMVALTQQVAPMSSPLSAGVCGGSQSTAEGIVFALDGLSAFADGSWAACNGATRPDCGPDPALPKGGVAYDTIIDYAQSCTQNSECVTNSCVAGSCAKPACVASTDCETGETCNTTSGSCEYNLGTNAAGAADADGWKRALRIIYGGLVTKDGSGSYGGRKCGSRARRYLASNFGKFFETCGSNGNCQMREASDNSSQQVGIRHAFRRNQESGTTDAFTGAIGLAKSQLSNQEMFCNAGTQGPTYCAAVPPDKACTVDADCLGTMASGCGAIAGPFCISGKCTIKQLAAQAPLADAVLPPPLRSGRADLRNTKITQCLAAGRNTGAFFTDLQDMDPIRRLCKQTGLGATSVPAQPTTSQEDVCSARGDLGLVLPIWDIPTTTAPQQDTFPPPARACTPGKFLCYPAVRDNCPPAVAHYALCPDGSDPNASNYCGGSATAASGACPYPVYQPTAADPKNPRCWQGPTISGLPVPTFDGRVMNLTSWTTDPVTGNSVITAVPRATGMVRTSSQNILPDTNVLMVGSYTKIHGGARTMLAAQATFGGDGYTCTSANPAECPCRTGSSTEQIGCLVHASPCTTGFAGNSGQGANNIAMKVNNVDPNNQCVQNFLTLGSSNAASYRLSRPLFLNSLKGFENVTGDELKLAKCYADGWGTADATSLGFVPLPATNAVADPAGPNNDVSVGGGLFSGRSYCADFNESACPGAPANVNACTGNDLIFAGGLQNQIPSCKFGEDPSTAGCKFGGKHPAL